MSNFYKGVSYMDIDVVEWLWKSVIIVLAGTILLRVAGRKSISQMTLAQTVIMIGIGSLLIQPLAGENIWSTLFVGSMLVITLLIVEYSQIKFNFLESLITGKAKVLIEDGNVNINNLRSVRLTVDQLETQLRQKSVTRIKDVKYATLEPNGQVGFVLIEEAKPATKKEINDIKAEIQQIKKLFQQQGQSSHSQGNETVMSPNSSQANVPFEMMKQLQKQLANIDKQLISLQQNKEGDLFREIETEKHNKSIPKHLQ